MLEVRDVTRRFGGLTAVSGVSFHVAEGEIVGLIGPNGAGKTTLFNVISGFLRADSGNIRFLDTDISRMDVHEVAEIGLARTFQTPAGFPGLTVRQNLLAVARGQRGESIPQSLFRWRAVRAQEQELELRADRLLRSFGLQGRENVLASNLSGGELKLLEVARLVMYAPHLLMLDEPASGVNPAALSEVMRHLRILRDEGMTILLIDHNLGFIMDICDRVYVMAHGELIVGGRPSEVADDARVRAVYLGEDTDAA